MKKILPALALLTLCTAVWLPPSSASAVPKMDVKVAVGVGSTTIVPRFPTINLYEGDDPSMPGALIGTVGGRNPGTFVNWGMQIGARVTFDNKAFFEMDAGFSRFYFDYGPKSRTFALAEGEIARGRRAVRQARSDEPAGDSADRGLPPLREPLFQDLRLWRLGQHLQPSRLRGVGRQSKGASVQAQRISLDTRWRSTSLGCESARSSTSVR